MPRAVRGSPSAAKLLIVDAVPQHDEKPDEELPGHGDPRFGASTPTREGEVQPPEVIVISGSAGRGLHQDHTQQGIALLGDLSQVPLVGGGVE